MASPRDPAAKAAALGIMYGMNPARQMGKSMYAKAYAQMQNLERHPLAPHSAYRHKGLDPRFGVHRYQCNNSTLHESVVGDELGTTGVRHSIYTNPDYSKNICIIAWVRRHGTERMKEAVACAIMLGHETIVIAHAFGAE